MMQAALQKERREMKQAARESEMDAVPVGLNKHWIDPMPDGKLSIFFNVRFSDVVSI
jgi:ATP-dependent RNA helicase DHX8/PRP22